MRLPPEILYWLGIFAIMMIGAVSCEQRERHRWSVMLLTLGGFFVYLAAARLTPYLNPWDELFHAQVAKNCMEHPFAPMLYDSNIVPNHNYGIWTCSHIWLHKQPLFIWQIALSFKIFGVSELSLRLPSVILCTLMIPLCYRMAFLLTQRRDTAFFTALCAACSWFLFRLTSGIQSTDHNDVSFIFYITASIWAFCEYIHSDRKAGWAALVGILAGAAVLTKWLTGLLVFGVWGLYLLTEHKFYIKDWKFKHLLLAFFVMLLIALPWQLYILQRFPEMAQQELLYNFKHINEDVEAHSGSIWYYLIILPMQYFGEGFYLYKGHFVWNFHTIICYLVLLSGLLLTLKNFKRNSHRITLIGTVLVVFIFFSLAKTKMQAFTFITCFAGFLSIASLLSEIAKLLTWHAKRPAVKVGILAVGCFFFCMYHLNYPNFYKTILPSTFAREVQNKRTYLQWKEKLPENCYIFNVKSPSQGYDDFTSCIGATFYSERQCYSDQISLKDMEEVKKAGKEIAVVRNQWCLEEWQRDSTIIRLDIE